MIDETTGEQRTEFDYTTTSPSYIHDGKKVYYVRSTNGHAVGGQNVLVNPVVSDYGDNSHDSEAAWTAVYGDISGGGSSIPVQWNRPYDAELLETSFSITVA